MLSNIYTAPLYSIYSDALAVLAYVMLNVVMDEYYLSTSETKHSKPNLKQSSEAVGPRTRVEPATDSASSRKDYSEALPAQSLPKKKDLREM